MVTLRIKPSERIGTTGLNNYGSKMIVDDYKSPTDIWVRFVENGIKVHTTWRNFLLGNVRNVYDKTVYGIGYIGVGEYKVTKDGKYTPQYMAWSSMIQRCYNQSFHEKQSTYNDCTVTESWLNFQNFAKWYDENIYEINGERMELDKDILIKGNKLYSPECCVFVPSGINTLFVKCNKSRGDLPIGIHLHGNNKSYVVQCGKGLGRGKHKYLGIYNTIEEAFVVYKDYKEKFIKQVAKEYKDKIPNKLYEAMMIYKVEITD